MTETKKNNTAFKVIAGIVCAIGLFMSLGSGIGMLYLESLGLFGNSEKEIEEYMDNRIAETDMYRLLEDLSSGRENDFRFNAELVSPNLQFKIVSVGIVDDPYDEDNATVVYETDGFSGNMNYYVYGHDGYGYWAPEGSLWDILTNRATCYGMDNNIGKGYYAYYEVVDDLDYSKADTDLYCQAEALAEFLVNISKVSVVLFVIGSIILVAGFILVVRSAGTEITFVHRIPYMFVLGALGAVALAIGGCIYGLLLMEVGAFASIVLISFAGLAFSAFAVLCLINTITRFKAKSFWRYTLIGYIVRGFSRISVIAESNSKMIIKLMMVIGVVTFIQICGLFWFANDHGFGLALFFIYKLIAVAIVIYLASQAKKIRDGMKRVVSGNLSEPIDTKGMLADFRAHAEDINNTGKGFSLAVAESVKSERMKADLITNVSHDIKTPLTSIINYVDLLKKEDLKSERADEYIEVLDRQSARLKKLTDDIVEASKASSGNIDMNIERVDLAVLLSQACGEFEEKFGSKGLELVKTLHQEQIYVNADGRYLWRIIDNLLRNIYKYAKNDTRVFLDTREKDGRVEVVFKNTSDAMLNISPEELTERFVRGDRSRNTEGSGLGLSIASSLAAGMGGNLKLDIDGDLFKAILDLEKAEWPVAQVPEEVPAIEAPVEE